MLEEIETLRNKLYDMLNKGFSLTSTEIVSLSQRLDILLNKYDNNNEKKYLI